MHSVKRSGLMLATATKQFTRSVAVSSSVVTNGESNLKSLMEIPGPSSLPVIGQLHHFMPGGSLYKTDGVNSTVMYERYGPIVRVAGFFGAPSVVLLYDAEAASQVLRGENLMPTRPGFISLGYFRNNYRKQNGLPPDAPTGLLTEHGEIWKKFRSTVNPILLHLKTSELYTNSLTRVAEDMIERMRTIRNEKNMLEGNFDVEMNLWALESIAVVALGDRLNCLDPNLPEESPAKKLLQMIHDIFKISEKLDFKPSLWRYVSTPNYRKAMKLYDDQMNLSKHFIAEAVKTFASKKTSTHEKGILEKLLDIDEYVAVTVANDLIFAGVDSTANTMTAILYFLAKNPDKQKKLREEILTDKEKRPYLRACIKESMRLMPVVSINVRVTTKEYNILGYKLPKDTYVASMHKALCKMEKHFPEPEKYIPERWLTEKDDPLFHRNAHPFAFTPFGFGTRMCIGRRIAELEMEIFLAKVVENFEMEWFGPPMEARMRSINYTIGPYNFIFKDVNK
ncbi:cytochrome P450 CYP12A2 [Bicyclus anynana]|uniref:Cytochrome P450 CYP12A2 n=1 Tax=Bicyclus anynana TaxID=110368 RepID=A0ABM3LG22_BICAN|nr:cytochrome P450 CYP12A2 [Bicyclus anynana]